MKVIKRADYKELLKKSFETALKKDESTDVIEFDIDVNSIYATIKYKFKVEIHDESSCIQTIEKLFKENIKKYIPEDVLNIRLVIPDKTIYINVAYSVTD